MAFELFALSLIFATTACAGYLTVRSVFNGKPTLVWLFIAVVVGMGSLSLPFDERLIVFTIVCGPIGFVFGTLLSIYLLIARRKRNG